VNLVLVLLGLVALYLGAELLVRHASALARALGASPLLIGLTVVAFGTSMPEMFASVASGLRGQPEIAFANVVGSNIANVGLILGLTALVYPLVADVAFLRREAVWMLGSTLVALPLLLDGRVGRLEGLAGLALLAVFVASSIVAARRSPAGVAAQAAADDAPTGRIAVLTSLVLTVVAIGILALGADLLVRGATGLALAWGVTERVVGLTVVALGTSLPELVTSVVAALRRETAIILGNVFGSNVFNLLAVLGVTAAIDPIAVSASGARVDLWVMTAFAIAPVPLMLRGLRLGRRGGAVLVVGYLAYVGYLVA
jgi:cation:H+ antiporter